MSSITIRKIDETLKKRLRRRAAEHGRSMEEEARVILRAAVGTTKKPKPRTGKELYDEIRRMIEPLGGIELAEMPPEYLGDPPEFK